MVNRVKLYRVKRIENRVILVDRRATYVEIGELQQEFTRRLAKLVDEHARKAWFMALPSGWFIRRDSGFQGEFRRIGRTVAKLIRESYS